MHLKRVNAFASEESDALASVELAHPDAPILLCNCRRFTHSLFHLKAPPLAVRLSRIKCREPGEGAKGLRLSVFTCATQGKSIMSSVQILLLSDIAPFAARQQTGMAEEEFLQELGEGCLRPVICRDSLFLALDFHLLMDCAGGCRSRFDQGGASGDDVIDTVRVFEAHTVEDFLICRGHTMVSTTGFC